MRDTGTAIRYAKWATSDTEVVRLQSIIHKNWVVMKKVEKYKAYF